MDIEYLKWKVEKADGFDLIKEGDDVFAEWVLYHNGYGVDPLAGDFNKTAQCQLLLQRACENIMTSHPSESIWFISMDCEDVKAYRFYGDGLDRSEDRVFKIEDNIDQAKESALKYIFDKEREG